MKVATIIVLSACLLAIKAGPSSCDVCNSINFVCNGNFQATSKSLSAGSWYQASDAVDYWSPTEKSIEVQAGLWGASYNGDYNIELRTDRPEGVTQVLNGLVVDEWYKINFAFGLRPGFDLQWLVVYADDFLCGEDIRMDSTLSQTEWIFIDDDYYFQATQVDGTVLKFEDPSTGLTGSATSCGTLLDAISVSPCSCPEGASDVDEYNYDVEACVEAQVLTQECDVVTVYSECNFGGDSLEVATSVDCLDWDPKSICVPEGQQATVYDLCWYENPENVFEANHLCFPGASNGLSLLNKNEGGKNLKGAQKKNARIVAN